jgi:hypothetical protein
MDTRRTVNTRIFYTSDKETELCVSQLFKLVKNPVTSIPAVVHSVPTDIWFETKSSSESAKASHQRYLHAVIGIVSVYNSTSKFPIVVSTVAVLLGIFFN